MIKSLFSITDALRHECRAATMNSEEFHYLFVGFMLLHAVICTWLSHFIITKAKRKKYMHVKKRLRVPLQWLCASEA